jgi:hypothetical protein
MLIPVRDRAEAAADRGKNDAARQNYNNSGGADRHHRACAGRLWRQLDGAGQPGQRPPAGGFHDPAGGKHAAIEPAALLAHSIATRHYDYISAERNGR